jgi:hypothetical protein
LQHLHQAKRASVEIFKLFADSAQSPYCTFNDKDALYSEIAQQELSDLGRDLHPTT